MRWLWSTLLMLVFVAFAAPARATDAEEQLQAAERAYDELDFEKALDLASAVVKQGGLNHDQLVRAYRVLGRSQAVLDRDAAARESFVALLTYSSDEKEDRNLPPKVTARWLEARGVLARYAERPGIEVAVTLKTQTPGILRVTTHDPTRIVNQVIVGYRWGTTGKFVTLPAAVGSATPVQISSPPPNVARLDFYAQAFDQRHNAVFEFGNPAAPHTEFARPSAPPSPVRTKPASPTLFERPIFWVIAGGVLAGTGAAVFFVTRGEKEEAPSTASLGPVLFCGADTRCR